ncbi:GH35 family endo-1,4-beta-xylanase/peptidoglycan/xylan/chitin deacetylase (PgdA/CDA1 family) [Arthrobacter sp. PL16]|uniref:endo-1,4-beta-xylanase n=1 Tax=Arthrobacter sp. PL16 TaxID=3071720 RepID=UPI002DF9FE93|nr:GH35 family endo-1,4-beta-xylanase/peptidoglycan/xylan/chitin deacetylase (PgdA/CDA1 family) [Arthrobacter sp. PL16]
MRRRCLIAGATAFGLVAGAGALALPAANAEEPAVLLSEDFEDGDFGPLTQNGGAALSVVDADGDKALLVKGRANDYDGVKTPANLLQAGGTYSFSAQVKLSAAAGTTTSARFVVEPAYSWVGNTTVSADAWTTVSGTFNAPAGADPATLRAYLGTGDLGAPYDYLVDDVVITGTAEPGDGGTWQPTPDPAFVPGGAVNPTATPVATARGTGNVVALTFDDGPNPGETTAILDLLRDKGITATFCIIGQNVQADGGAELLRRIVAEGHTLCNHGTSYADMGSWTQAQVESDLKENLRIIRAAVGDPALAVPYFRAPNGSWGATGEVAAALGMQPLGLGNVIFDWDGNDLSEATLTENLRKAFTPGAVVLAHDGGGDRSNTVRAVTTVVGEKLAEGWTFALPSGGASAGETTGITSSFESGTDGWTARGDGVQVTAGSDARTGTGSLLVTNRTQPWHGAALDVTAGLPVGVAVEVSVWAKLAPGQQPASLKVSVQRDNGGGSAYDGVAGAGATVTADGWTQLKGTYTLGGEADKAQVYVEGPVGVDFVLDDFSLAPFAEKPIQTDVPGLKDVLGADGIEHVGVAIDARETTGTAADLIRKHFNAFTPENAGKPESVQPVEGQFAFTQLDQLLDFADANGVEVYGHVLAWHSQTPAWFFKDGTRDLTNSPADQALLKARMEAHIKGIADHIDARYPEGDSPIWAWDVVNEVIADGDTANPHDMRDSRWFQVLGEGFVDEAFRLADRYFPDAALFINDYNTEMPEKRADYLDLIRGLEARNVPIDGVGHQAHVDVARPVQWLEDSIKAVEALNPELLQAITELDVNASTENQGADVSGAPVDPYSPAFENDEDAAAEVGYYYRDLFSMLREHNESVDSVTFWGISNARTWLRTWPMARPWEQPLPFDDDLQVTPAYWGIVDPSRLPARPADVLPPRIADQSDVQAVSNGASGAKVAYTLPSAIDTLDGAVQLDCVPAPGTRFRIGVTTVTCTAADEAGNVRTSSFDVVVTRTLHGKP